MSEYLWKAERMKMGPLKGTLVRRSQTQATHLVVLCHGFGAPGDDLLGCAEYFAGECEEKEIVPIFAVPQAPLDLSSMGMYGARAWWEINMARLMQMNEAKTFADLRTQTPPGIDEARDMLVEGIQAVQTEYDVSELPLIIGGFSQGAMLTVDVALRGLPKPPSAILVYSGALICEPIWRANLGRLASMKIFQSHGTEDAVLPFETGAMLRDLLLEGQSATEFLSFRGPHTIPTESLERSMDILESTMRS